MGRPTVRKAGWAWGDWTWIRHAEAGHEDQRVLGGLARRLRGPARNSVDSDLQRGRGDHACVLCTRRAATIARLVPGAPQGSRAAMTMSPTVIEPILAADDIRWLLVEPAPSSTVTEAVAAVVKSVICRVVAACPVRRWPRLSAIARRLWPGFSSA